MVVLVCVSRSFYCISAFLRVRSWNTPSKRPVLLYCSHGGPTKSEDEGASVACQQYMPRCVWILQKERRPLWKCINMHTLVTPMYGEDCCLGGSGWKSWSSDEEALRFAGRRFGVAAAAAALLAADAMPSVCDCSSEHRDWISIAPHFRTVILEAILQRTQTAHLLRGRRARATCQVLLVGHLRTLQAEALPAKADGLLRVDGLFGYLNCSWGRLHLPKAVDPELCATHHCRWMCSRLWHIRRT